MAARTKIFVDIITKGTDGKEPGAGLKKLAIGAGVAGVAIAGLIKIGKELISVFEVQEQAETAIAAAIKATGKEAEISVGAMKDYASSLQEVTLFGDEAILSGQALLQSLADLDQEGLQSVTPAVLDFATAMKVDVQTAMSLVGKTLGSSTNALTRYGIEIDTSGTKAEKLAQVTEALTSKFGGMAEAAGSTATGSIKQLDNATGDLKEAYGAFIAEGLEPMNRLLTEQRMAWAELINQQRDAIKFTKDFRDGTIDEVRSLEDLQDILAGLEKQTGQAGRGGFIKDEIAAVKVLIDTYGIQDTFLIQAADSARVLAQVGIDAATKTKTELDLQLSAREKLVEITTVELTGKEKEIANLQTQIDQWASLRTNMEDTSDVQDLINELTAQRNDLLIDEDVALKDLVMTEEELGLMQANNAIDFNAGLVENIDKIKEMDQAYADLIGGGLSAFASSFKQIGQDGVTGWDVFKQAGKDAISAILEGLAQMALARAVLSLVALDFVGAAGWAAAASGAYAASGVVQSFATGGSFITDGSSMIGDKLVGDNASGQERVTVEPLGGSGGGSNNTGQIMVLRIGDRDIKAVVQGWIDNRGLHSSKGGAI